MLRRVQLTDIHLIRLFSKDCRVRSQITLTVLVTGSECCRKKVCRHCDKTRGLFLWPSPGKSWLRATSMIIALLEEKLKGALLGPFAGLNQHGGLPSSCCNLPMERLFGLKGRLWLHVMPIESRMSQRKIVSIYYFGNFPRLAYRCVCFDLLLVWLLSPGTEVAC